MKKYILFFIICFMIVRVAFNQNAVDDFKAMNKFYLSQQHLSMDIEYKFYENHSTKKVYQTQQAKYKKSGAQFYYAMDGITTVQNNTYKLAVYEANDVVVVSKKSEEIDSKIFTGAFVDSTLELCDDIKYSILDSGNKQFLLEYTKSKYFPYSKIVVELKPGNTLAKLTYYYKNPINYTPQEDDIEEAPRLEVVYKNMYLQPISNSQYSLNKYVKIQGSKVNLINKYSSYRLINQLL